MGIPYYFYRICQKYNGIVRDHIPSPDILYFDYNSLIHPCVAESLKKNAKTTDMLIDHIIKYTEEIVMLINPKQEVVIAIDGVAPRAKMNQQRERRYKKHFVDPGLSRVGPEQSRAPALCGSPNGLSRVGPEQSRAPDLCGSPESSQQPFEFDTNMITPGTSFMKRLNSRLKDHQWPFKMTLSDSTEQGEGEHKIMKLIVEKKDPNLSHVIYGMDGDLIMLSLISDKKIYLFRDQHGKSDQNTRVFLDIQRLKNGIVSHVKSTVELEELNESQILFDYLVMCFLLGNDFLPTFADLSILGNGIELLEKAYQTLISKGSYLTKEPEQGRVSALCRFSPEQGRVPALCRFSPEQGRVPAFTINFESLDVFIKSLSRSEQGRKKRIFKDVEFIQELKSQNVHVNIESHFIRTKELYNIYYDLGDKKKVVTEWIRGLEWVLGYYQQHSHQNWTWFYPYENAPHIYDVLDMSISLFQPTNFEKTDPFTELQQLFMVLPKSSFKDNIFLTNLSESVYFKKFFPSVLCLDAINKMYLWQCKPIGLPQFDENIIKTVLK